MKKEYQDPIAEVVSFLVFEDVLTSGDPTGEFGTGYSSVADPGL